MAEKKGIIRRIDDLGRIVIPREYRKLHGIELGDPIEITALESGEIVLKRVNVAEQLLVKAARVLEAAAPELPGTLLVSDFDQFIIGYGERKVDFADAKIGKWAAKLLQNRGNYLGAAQDQKEGFDLSAHNHFSQAAVLPINSNGDCYGGLFYLSTETIGSETFRVLKIICAVIAAGMTKY